MICASNRCTSSSTPASTTGGRGSTTTTNGSPTGFCRGREEKRGTAQPRVVLLRNFVGGCFFSVRWARISPLGFVVTLFVRPREGRGVRPPPGV